MLRLLSFRPVLGCDLECVEGVFALPDAPTLLRLGVLPCGGGVPAKMIGKQRQTSGRQSNEIRAEDIRDKAANKTCRTVTLSGARFHCFCL